MTRRQAVGSAVAWAFVLMLWQSGRAAAQTTTTAEPTTTTTPTPCTTPPTDPNGWALCTMQHDTENQRAELLTAGCIVVFAAGFLIAYKVWHP